MKVTAFPAILFVSAFLALASCEEQENQLEGVVLFNPFETDNGIELMKIDSFREWHGPNPLPNIKGYFHVNYEHFTDTSQIHRVIVYRDGVAYSSVAPGNQSYFVDIFAWPGQQYEYQLSIVMDDNSETKKTIGYPVDF
jgi:hypothetical protein